MGLLGQIRAQAERDAERQKKVTAAGKAADFWRKSMGTNAVATTGVSDEEWANLSNEDKASAHVGIMSRFAVQRAAKDLDIDSANVQTLLDAAAERKAAAKADEAFNKELTARMASGRLGAKTLHRAAPAVMRAASVMPGLADVAGAMENVQAPEPGIADIPEMAARSGQDPLRATQIAENVARAKRLGVPGAGEQPPYFSSTGPQVESFPDLPGLKRLVLGPNQSQAIATGEGQQTATPIKDGEKTVGYAYPTGKGVNVHWLTDSGFPPDARIESQNGVNVVVDKDGRILKTVGQVNTMGILLQDALGGRSGGGRGTNAPAASPLPAKGNPKDPLGLFGP